MTLQPMDDQTREKIMEMIRHGSTLHQIRVAFPGVKITQYDFRHLGKLLKLSQYSPPKSKGEGADNRIQSDF